MAEENTAEPNLFARSVVLRVPGVEAVEVIRDQPWGDERAFDLYRPPGRLGTGARSRLRDRFPGSRIPRVRGVRVDDSIDRFVRSVQSRPSRSR